MENEKTVLTKEGYRQLVEQLEYLKTTGRDEIAEKIKEARSFGDLSENAEYDEAMNDQAKMEAQIAKLEVELRDAVILDEDQINGEVVGVGSKVQVNDKTFNEIIEYQILGKNQADPEAGIISDSSPVGKALIGHSVGETVKTELPTGAILEMEILSIL